MQKSLNPRAMALSFGLAIIILAWASVTSYWVTHQLVRSMNGLGEAHQALETLQSIDLIMESAESSVRGYVITGDERRLSDFRAAKRVVPGKLSDLSSLMPAHSRKGFRRLQRLLSSQLLYLSNTVAQRQIGGAAAAAQWIAGEDESSNRDVVQQMLIELQHEERSQLKERSSYTAEHSLQSKAASVFTAAGMFGLLIWVFSLLRREAAVRRLAESTSERTEKFLQSIVERIPYMITVKEAENLRITFVNKAAEEWMGRSQADLLQSNAFDLRPHGDAVAVTQNDRDALRDGTPIDIPEEMLVLPGKDQRILHTQKIPMPDEQGHPAYLLTISEDITQRKQAEKMLELSRDSALESARLKAEFIRNMSHEIRTPLSIVIGMTDLLLDTELGADQRRFAATVKRAADGLLNLSKSILDFSKMESGTFALETREVDLRKVVDDVVTMLREQAKTKGVALVSLVSKDIPMAVRGDPTRFRQVLTQLVGNAVKFTERGEVIIRVTEAKHSDSQVWLHCRISDTGIGIPEDQQKDLFQAFRQGDGSRTRRYGGTGLGLAVSKRIVELMGGDIGFESAAGKGSTFWCTIPFNKRHVQGPVIQMASRQWARARILVIDENETARQILQEQLRTWALASETASGAQTALELLRREHQAGRAIPIVILDMHLPDMDAVALAREIRNDAALASTKLLVLTSPEAPMDPATALSLGFASWLVKPPKAEDLYERLASLIEPRNVQDRENAA